MSKKAIINSRSSRGQIKEIRLALGASQRISAS
jgi:hypothetical protein